MKKEDLKFTIDQLRKDKIIYAVEACATNLLCIFLFLFVNYYLPLSRGLKGIFNWILLVISVGYTLYMAIGNFYRLKKILHFEKNYER